MSKSNLKSFYNEKFGTIRTMTIDDAPWFAGKDVATALGYQNTKDALIRHVDSDDKKIIQRSEISTIENHIPSSAFPANFVSADIPNRGLSLINESGLYSLVLSSKLPAAKEFKHWVTSEVLPSIRKHGAYITEPVIQQVLKNPETVYQLAEALIKEHNKVEELTPYANLAKDVMACDNCYTMKEIANLIETGRNTLYNLLRQAGVLSKQTGYNLPLQRYLNSGYFKVKADKPGTKFVITQKGLMFIHKLIKKSNLDNEFDTDKLIELAQKINVA